MGGDQATDQAPVTCRPNAAQSMVPGGLRAHTRETGPLPQGGVADRAGSGAGAPPRPPIRPLGGYHRRVGPECARVALGQGTMGSRQRGEPPP